MKRFLVLAAFFALAAPAAFAAPPAGTGKPETSASSSPGQGSAALCREQLKTMGATNFQATFAPKGNGKNAWGKCVSRQSQLQGANQQNAAKVCKAERGTTQDTMDVFAKKWGTNANMRNAFGKCVSATARGLTAEQQDATLDAAKSCQAERGNTADTVKAFADKYGTGNKKNAFGKCVVATKKKQQQESGDD